MTIALARCRRRIPQLPWQVLRGSRCLSSATCRVDDVRLARVAVGFKHGLGEVSRGDLIEAPTRPREVSRGGPGPPRCRRRIARTRCRSEAICARRSDHAASDAPAWRSVCNAWAIRTRSPTSAFSAPISLTSIEPPRRNSCRERATSATCASIVHTRLCMRIAAPTMVSAQACCSV
jgi:hypothetical protein